MVRDRRSLDTRNQSGLAFLALLGIGFAGVEVAAGFHVPKPWWWLIPSLAVAAAVGSWRWYGQVIRRAKADGDHERVEKVRGRVYWSTWAAIAVLGTLGYLAGKLEKVSPQPLEPLPATVDEPVERGNP